MQLQTKLMFPPNDIGQILPQQLDFPLLLLSPDGFGSALAVYGHQFRHLVDASLEVISLAREVVDLGLEGLREGERGFLGG